MRWNVRESGTTAALIAFAALTVSPCLAGEGFLNRNAKVNDAIPYGRAGDGTPAPATPPTPAPPNPTPSVPQP